MTTSQQARAAHEPTAQSHRETILSYVRTFPGHTAAEIAQATRIERHEVSRRLPELEKAGDVTRGSERPCETNGHKMATWLPAAWRPPANGADTQARLF